ncbi:hypothetical protein BCD48_38115 [Pseudofrankia sp. BMG5.36]|nr:hypothetical protein BCD48_38115 [Pseudofrankia sp. BMG5.36]
MAAVITGGARGLGLGITRLFLDQGAKVCMAGRTQSWGDEAVEQFQKISDDVMFVQCDVAEEADVARCVAAAVERFGSLHIVVNNAGGTTFGTGAKACDTELAEFQRAFHVNTDGPFLMAKHAIAHMLDAGYGSIVNVSSNAAIRASANANVGYHASKAALHGLTLSLAREYGPQVRCNEIVMGHLHPPNPDLPRHRYVEEDEAARTAVEQNYMVGRWGSPDDLGYACVFLASRESGFITATSLRLDGGSQSRMQFPHLTGYEDWLATQHSAQATA